jgi:hypothetical protein
MAKMTKAIHQLIDIFTRTNDDMMHEYKRGSISKHFQKISDQNEAIAQALLNLAQPQEAPITQQQTQPIGVPNQGMPQNTISNTNQMQPNMMPPLDIQTPGEQTNMMMPGNMNESMQGMNSPAQQAPINPLDLPPPEHKKKKLGLFK